MPAMTTKKRKPQDAVVSNVKRLRAEVRALAKLVRYMDKRLIAVERSALKHEKVITHIGNGVASTIVVPGSFRNR